MHSSLKQSRMLPYIGRGGEAKQASRCDINYGKYSLRFRGSVAIQFECAACLMDKLLQFDAWPVYIKSLTLCLV